MSVLWPSGLLIKNRKSRQRPCEGGDIQQPSCGTSSERKVYKPVNDQLEELNKAIHMICTKTIKVADKEFKLVRKMLRSYVLLSKKKKKKTLQDRKPLHIIFEQEREKCENDYNNCSRKH